MVFVLIRVHRSEYMMLEDSGIDDDEEEEDLFALESGSK
jgi:hypothetical protein